MKNIIAPKLGKGWFDIKHKLPEELEAVFVSSGNGWTTIGCLVYDVDYRWH